MAERPVSGPAPRLKAPAGTIDTHMHFFPEGYAAQPGGPPIPWGKAGVAEYRQVMARLGIDRVVVVQSNAYRFDNSALLAMLGELGDVARGVAVVTGETSDAEMDRLHAAGVRGARIMDLLTGAVGIDRVKEVDDRVRGHGWQLTVQFDGSRMLDMEPRLAGLGSDYVIDHHGKMFSGAAPDDPKVDAVKRLIDRGNCYFKFCACYEVSRDGPPDYADIGAVAREMARHAPERIVWGSNWPHVQMKPDDYPDDAALMDLMLDWIPDEAARRLAFVDNPERLFGWRR